VEKYGNFVYALYDPAGQPPECTEDAFFAFLDLFAEAHGLDPLARFREESERRRGEWLNHILESRSEEEIYEILLQRRYVILEGPPGTGKTRMARRFLEPLGFPIHGRTIQFHPSTTYESFVTGLAPALSQAELGLRFETKRGHLVEAVAAALGGPDHPYLLHIDSDLSGRPGQGAQALRDLPPRAGRSRPRRHAPVRQRGARRPGAPPPAEPLPPRHHELGRPQHRHPGPGRSPALRLRAAVARPRGARGVRGVPAHDLGLRAAAGALPGAGRRRGAAAHPGPRLLPRDRGRDPEVMLSTGLKPLLLEYLAQGFVAGFADDLRAYLEWLG
jgi:5-methylcytosine-specific restriction enzyme B